MDIVRLTCRLHREIDENFEKFEIEAYIDCLIDSIEKNIYEKVKRIDDKIFSDIDHTELTLWMVEMHDDDFSKFDLKNDDAKGIKKFRRRIGDYWKEQPSTEFIHVIVDSPSLLYKRRIAKLEEQLRNTQIRDTSMFS